MTITSRVGNTIIVDLSKIPYEFGSPEFINLHLKDLSIMDTRGVEQIRYEEEETFTLGKKETGILIEYAQFIRSVESVMLKPEIYGLESDPNYQRRKDVLRQFYDYLFMNPRLADEILTSYSEPTPSRAVFMKGQQVFMAWKAGILKRFHQTKMYQLVMKMGDMRSVFLSMLGLKSLYFVDVLLLDLPKNAEKVKDKKGHYKLPYGLEVQLYDLVGTENYLYVITNPHLNSIDTFWKKQLHNLINVQMKEDFQDKDYSILFELKVKEYRQYFLNMAISENKPLSPEQALAMGREAASWTVGLGSPLENVALDEENVIDIYIDSENIPIYLEHEEFGICHTLYRYNRPLLERSFKNIVLGSGTGVKFDDKMPIADVVLKRLSMRCHLQRPPATFRELQGTFRIMKEEPFTYPQYFSYMAMTPFFAGYDDVMVNLGNSEAVLGIKGSGKTCLTSAKIAAIGQKMRIIAIQDIEEMPIRAYRKRGFHISTVRVQSTSLQRGRSNILDLVSMANALLRMGDAAILINEVRSREAVQGIINLLNTQPGVFLLYNLHAESLQEIQDRFELVFGIPSVCMLSTDRYTFLMKTKFGRKSRFYRLVGNCYETNHKTKKFDEIFGFKRANNIERSVLEAKFIKNKDASTWLMGDVDFKKLEKELNLNFVPPALERRAENTSVPPEQYILQAFYKGKVFEDIYLAYKQTKNNRFLGLDFVLRANAHANNIMLSLEDENGEIDFARAYAMWQQKLRELVSLVR